MSSLWSYNVNTAVSLIKKYFKYGLAIFAFAILNASIVRPYKGLSSIFAYYRERENRIMTYSYSKHKPYNLL